MDLSADHEAHPATDENRWSETNAFISASDTEFLPTQLATEYAVLAGVAAYMSCGFILLNQREHIAYFNTNAVRLLGVSRQQLLEAPTFDVRKQLLARARDPQRVQPDLDHAWLHPEQEAATDMALADAAVRWLRVQFFPVRNAPGHLLGHGVLLEDITLERAALEARSETLALAAHELKTPLAVIKGCATTLLSNSMHWDPAIQHEMLQMIDTQADRLYEVLNTLLDVWKLDAGAQTLRCSPVELADLLAHMLERWQRHTPGRRFALHAPAPAPTAPAVICDAARIQQALNALLNNAVKYSPPDGLISIAVEYTDVAARLSISDSGVGIAPEHLDHIFDRFYRVQQGGESEGRGLGLAVARATIEAHGGKIWADSAGAGLGSTFYFTLPFSPRLQAGASGQLTSAPPASARDALPQSSARSAGILKQSQRPHLLVAEGDARLSRYLRANLEEHAYSVHAVTSGVQFLRQVDLEEPDLVLLSTRLTDTGGAELLQRAREFLHTPVIMLCDACDEDERVRLFDLGADDLVIKPFGMKELLARVRALLRRSAASPDGTSKQAVFSNGDLTIDYAQHLVLLNNQPVQLSRTEYKLLSTLAQNVGIVLTHEVLLERVWGPEYNREVDFIWVYISRLRRKIETDPRHPRYILTVPDVGYKLAKV